jgi:hypothetical protein
MDGREKRDEDVERSRVRDQRLSAIARAVGLKMSNTLSVRERLPT